MNKKEIHPDTLASLRWFGEFDRWLARWVRSGGTPKRDGLDRYQWERRRRLMAVAPNDVGVFMRPDGTVRIAAGPEGRVPKGNEREVAGVRAADIRLRLDEVVTAHLLVYPEVDIGGCQGRVEVYCPKCGGIGTLDEWLLKTQPEPKGDDMKDKNEAEPEGT